MERAGSMAACLIFMLTPLLFCPGDSKSEDVQALIREISAKQRRIETLTANFSQRKETSLVQGPLLFTGVVKFKRPDRIHFLYAKPEPMEFSLDGKFLWIYDPKQFRTERFPLSRNSRVGSYMESVTRIFQKTLDQLAEEYSIQALPPDRGESCRFQLHPRKEKLQAFIKEVELRIDKDSGAILTFQMIEPNQDRLILEFQNLRINPPLTDRDLEIKVPHSGHVQERQMP
jgi:outer membrane lipoprotein-sorting protein